MRNPEAAFLALLFSGLLALLAGLMLTRVYWRPDIPPYGRGTRFLGVALHPEEYTKDAPLSIIRWLNFTGACLLAGGIGVLACELLRTILQS
jgi:hypothetical protein